MAKTTRKELTNELPEPKSVAAGLISIRDNNNRVSCTRHAGTCSGPASCDRMVAAELKARIAEPSIPVVQAAQVAVTGNTAVVEASTLGFAPGAAMPSKLVFLTAAGKPFTFEGGKAMRPCQGPYAGEITGWSYVTGSGSKARFLHILNT